MIDDEQPVPGATGPARSGEPQPRRLPLSDADVVFLPSLMPGPTADALWQRLTSATGWTQLTLRAGDRTIALPRLTAWHADPGLDFCAPGITIQPAGWTPDLLEIRDLVESASGASFNGVLLTLYRDGQDGVAWHSDDQPEFGPEPVIGSVSLGASRLLEFRPKYAAETAASIMLTHGSCLIMRGQTQQFWEHQIPKAPGDVGPRLNLNFRRIFPDDRQADLAQHHDHLLRSVSLGYAT
jgi:alkylated DNA repair dioxygenase AlkB